MNLNLDPLQQEFARAVAGIHPDSAWTDLARIRAFALGLPLGAGGLDLGLGAQAVVDSALGATLRPVPGYHDTLLAGDLLSRLPDARAAELCKALAEGEIRAVTEGVHSGPCGWLDDTGHLHGVTGLLPDAPWSLVVLRTQRDVLVVVDPHAKGCTSERVQTVAGQAVRLTFAGAPCLVVSVEPPDLGPAIAAARIRQAAYLSGIACTAIDAAAQHVRRREQFGRRLIEFQTVGHRLAALVAEGDGLTLLIHEAAWRIDTGRPVGVQAPQALAAAAEHALAATRLAVQLHGARGIVAGSAPASAFLIAAVEAVRLGTPDALWREAGQHRIAERHGWDDEGPVFTTDELESAPSVV